MNEKPLKLSATFDEVLAIAAKHVPKSKKVKRTPKKGVTKAKKSKG